MTPNEFWSRTPQRPSWRLYVALCEFTSALLDYATGIYLCRRGPEYTVLAVDDSPPIFRGSRLNWAATCFYYSLMHLGRMLVFLPFGDFPTSHADLVKCFKRGNPVRTRWLEKLTTTLHPHGSVPGDMPAAEGDRVGFSGVAGFYSDRIHCQEAEDELLCFGEVLKRAKGLREDNNYEALLIAHEYAHVSMTRAFRTLAERMRTQAERFLKRFGEIVAKYLAASTGEPWDCGPQDKIAFGRLVLRDRAVEATRTWYGSDVEQLIQRLTEPVLSLGPGDPTGAARIRQDVEKEFFPPKRGLMEHFMNEVAALDSADEPTLGRSSTPG